MSTHHANSCLAAFLLLAAGSAPAQSSDGPPGDARVTDAVEDELWSDMAVPSAQIDVSTVRGVVTLEGAVDNILARQRAERIAETIRGVRSVVNRLQVSPAAARTDEQIAGDVNAALRDDPATDSYQIDVSVDDGKLTLTGKTESFAEKELCATVAKGVQGVKAVDNLITVHYDSERPDSGIAADIRKTLMWDEYVDNTLIDVRVEDGAVKLSGTVGSAAEKRRARQIAWVAGVTSVDSGSLDVDRRFRDPMMREDKYVARSDDEIADAIEDALLYDPRVESYDIDVEVEDGAVTLRGKIDNLKARRAAANDARNTVGVWRVVNRVKVRPVDRTGDSLIADQVRSALERDPYVDRFPITVHVRAGTAFLYGRVDSDFERNRAEDIAARTIGIVDVRNHLEVDGFDWTHDPYVDSWWSAYPLGRPYRAPDLTNLPYPALTDDHIADAVRDSMWWSPFVDADQVEVRVEDGVAFLTGTVDSWSEFVAASESAYEGGARRVRNRLRIANRGDQR